MAESAARGCAGQRSLGTAQPLLPLPCPCCPAGLGRVLLGPLSGQEGCPVCGAGGDAEMSSRRCLAFVLEMCIPALFLHLVCNAAVCSHLALEAPNSANGHQFTGDLAHRGPGCPGRLLRKASGPWWPWVSTVGQAVPGVCPEMSTQEQGQSCSRGLWVMGSPQDTLLGWRGLCLVALCVCHLHSPGTGRAPSGHRGSDTEIGNCCSSWGTGRDFKNEYSVLEFHLWKELPWKWGRGDSSSVGEQRAVPSRAGLGSVQAALVSCPCQLPCPQC